MLSTRYRRIADELIGEIQHRRWQIGETLPGELELMQRFAVSRHTVRSALRIVQDLGLIERRAGIGTQIIARRPRALYVQHVRTPAALMQYPAGSRLRVSDTAEVVADRKLAQLLECRRGERWFRISAVRRLAGAGGAIGWTDIYLLPQYAEVAQLIGRRAGLVSELIERQFGERVEHVRVDLRGGVIDGEVAQALRVEPRTPALTVIRRYTGRGGRVFEVAVSSHPADRYEYSFELKRGWQGERHGN